MGQLNSRGWVPVKICQFFLYYVLCPFVSCRHFLLVVDRHVWISQASHFRSGLSCHFLFKFVESMIDIQSCKKRARRDGSPNQKAPIRREGGPNQTVMSLSFVFIVWCPFSHPVICMICDIFTEPRKIHNRGTGSWRDSKLLKGGFCGCLIQRVLSLHPLRQQAKTSRNKQKQRTW